MDSCLYIKVNPSCTLGTIIELYHKLLHIAQQSLYKNNWIQDLELGLIHARHCVPVIDIFEEDIFFFPCYSYGILSHSLMSHWKINTLMQT